MKKIFLTASFIVFYMFNALGQQLYVPEGFTDSGIGYSSTDNVGIGTDSPQSTLDVNGNIQISNAYVPMGLMTEVGGTTPLLNLSVNFREPNKNTSYLGAAFRIDTRNQTSAPLFQWLVRNGGADNTIMALSGVGNLGIGKIPTNYKLDVAGDINFTGNLLQNGQPFSGGGSSLWSQPGYDISSNGDVLIPGDYKLKFGNRGVATSGHFYIFSSSILYNTYADISQGSLYFRKANYGDNNGAILGIQSNKTVTINYWETYDNSVIDTKGHALAVNGGIMAHYFDVDGKINAQEVEVKPDVWQDIVFDKDYKLMSLIELENYINTHKHLPSVPSEAEVKEKGIKIGEMNAILLGKVEELTRYVIELKKEIDQLKKK